jgi:hypothetical protein
VSRDPRYEPRKGDILQAKRTLNTGVTRTENLVVLAAFNGANQTNSYVEWQWMTVLGFPVDFIGVPENFKGHSGQVLDLKSFQDLVKHAGVLLTATNYGSVLLMNNPDHLAILKAQDAQRDHDRATAFLMDYFSLEQQVHKLFGYEEGYRTFPMVNCLDYFWSVNSDEVNFADTEKAMEDPTYQCELHRTRHLPQNVWRSQHHTMILYNTGADFNVHLGIFDNTKEVKS